MSTLTTEWVRVDSLFTGAQIKYDGQQWIVQEVLKRRLPLTGWIVIAVAVQDRLAAARVPLEFANANGVAELEHRTPAVSR